jgi:hypothetical protein
MKTKFKSLREKAKKFTQSREDAKASQRKPLRIFASLRLCVRLCFNDFAIKLFCQKPRRKFSES